MSNSSTMKTNPYQLKNIDFVDSIAVVCPRCSKKAVVSGGQPVSNTVGFEEAIQFTCTYCVYVLKYANTPKFPVFTNSRGVTKYARVLFFDSQTDPYFNFPLWYIIETPWGNIWAYNAMHLEVIENYIGSKDRNRNGIPVQNDSIASRLPQWAKSAKHRETLLKLIRLSK
ncbi:hypothetical protein [Vaginella massiliensis]|uniref:hypothetical protein n=1 Tax=Vaginella massiliensis TaxID=1816680 RepID=UPI0012B5A8F9|nr:hypothetical protein [Vaginella massiliensis]